MHNLLKKLRNRQYNLSVYISLFFLFPIFIRMPSPALSLFIKVKSYIRYKLGTYRAYIDRRGLKKRTIENISGTLKVDSKTANNIFYQLMYLEVIVERNAFLLDTYRLSDLKKHFLMKGEGNLQGALKKGKGVILPSIHSGDTMLFMLYMSLLGFKIYGFFDGSFLQKENFSPLEKFALLKDQKITTRIGKLYTGSGLKNLYKVLNDNGIIVWMIDLPSQKSKRSGNVSFLGKDIAIDTTFLEISKKTGSALLPCILTYDNKRDIHTIDFKGALEPGEKSVQDLFSLYEPFIIKHPGSWIGWYIFDLFKSPEIRQE